MIIIRVIGGLGNQLFIYAFGRSLQLNLNLQVNYDTYSGFINDPFKRKFELDNFNTSIKSTSFLNSCYYPLIKRSKIITSILFPYSKFLEENEYFSIANLKLNTKFYRKVFLQGYFQNPVYFENIKRELLKELILAKSLSEIASKYLEEINDNNSVGVHIRRRGINNIAPLSFYINNIRKLKNELKFSKFFIFSDDIKWCMENIGIDESIVFIENTKTLIEDFWLMKNCKHFIIPNSTFSWWASYLSNYLNKILIIYNF